MWRPIISPWVICFQSGIFSLRWLKWLFTFGPTRGGSAGIILYHSMPPLLYLGISTTCGGLSVESLQPSLDVSGKLSLSCSCISCSSSVQVSGRTCQRSTLTFDFGGALLDGGSLVSHSCQHVRHSLVVSHHKKSCHGCFSWSCAQWSDISVFNPLAGQRCVLCR